MTEVKEEVQQWYQYSGGEKNGNASASSGSIMAARAGRRTMDKGDDSVADRQRSGLSSVSGEWQNDHPDPLTFPPPVGSGRSSEGRGQQEQQEERDEEEDHDSRSNNGAAPADTIDYDFWSAISSTPQRPMQHH